MLALTADKPQVSVLIHILREVECIYISHICNVTCAQHCKLQMLLQAKCECLSPHYMVSHLVVLQTELLESSLPQSDAALPIVDLLQPLTLMRRRHSLLLRYLQQTLHHILWK